MRRAMVVTLAAMTVVPAEAGETTPQLTTGVEVTFAPELPDAWGVGLVMGGRAKIVLRGSRAIAPTIGGQLRLDVFGDRRTLFTVAPTAGIYVGRDTDNRACFSSPDNWLYSAELRPGLAWSSTENATAWSLGLGLGAQYFPVSATAEVRTLIRTDQPTKFDRPTALDRSPILPSLGVAGTAEWGPCANVMLGRPLRLTPDPADALTLPEVAASAHTPTSDDWLRRAQEELAAVLAFARLAHELRAIGAPASLVARCEAAARDELLHGQLCLERAVAHGAGRIEVDALDAPVRTWPSREAALAHLGHESLHDGFLNEGAAARDAWDRAAEASDPADVATFERIARDETRHAWLGADIAAWCVEQLAA